MMLSCCAACIAYVALKAVNRGLWSGQYGPSINNTVLFKPAGRPLRGHMSVSYRTCSKCSRTCFPGQESE